MGDVRLAAAARLVRVSPRTLRHDVEIGLVQPARVEGTVVFFGESQLAEFRRIRRLRRDLGLNTAGVELALRLLDEIRSLREQLDTRGRTPPGPRPPREA
jgi:DNA-binding transcriptional MerR regulator